MARSYDICVYGATGFTGKRIIKYLVSKNTRLRIAVAGRSESKLTGTLAWVQHELKGTLPNSAKVGTVIADNSNYESLVKMCEQTKLVINAVGPYRFLGEDVVKACIQARTNYVDVTGEPEFIDSMILKYSELAAANNVTCVFSCGFDSVPADIGYAFAVANYPSCESVSAFHTVYNTLNKKLVGHYTTYQCAVEGFGSQGNLKRIRSELSKVSPFPKTTKATTGAAPFYHPSLKKYAMTFPGADASVVRNTQRLQHQREKTTNDSQVIKPRFNVFFTLSSFMSVVLIVIVGIIFAFLAKSSWGRKLLLAYPRIFSLGHFSHDGPTEEVLESTRFQIDFISSGKDGVIETRVSGPEPGYVATPILVSEAALVMLESSDKLPFGCVTPCFAFEKTKYLPNLIANGISFEVVSNGRSASK